jgi:hypothetical protein
MTFAIVVDGPLPADTLDLTKPTQLRANREGELLVSASSGGATGPGTAATAGRVTLASDDPLLSVLPDAYEPVAASATAQILGATGAVGDFLSGVLIVPGTTAAGAVSIIDGNGSNISIFAGGGTTALTTLIPFFVPIGAKCVNSTTPGWKVTTGANVTAIGVGNFT